ncbi:MAG: efflux RND transporter periplasmic adaptor subunit [Polyangiales bacterium]
MHSTHAFAVRTSIGLAAVSLVLSTLMACDRRGNHAAAAPVPLRVEVTEVVVLDRYEVRRTFSGVVRSRRATRLGFERGGLVAEVFVDEGDAVDDGQLVARLDTAQLRAARKRIVASLAEAEAGVGISALTAGRLTQLADEEFISRQSADEATFGLQAAEAKKLELQAALAQIDVDLRKSRLVAPFSGVVSTRLVDEGTVVGAGAPIVTFRESDQKEAIIGVPTFVSIPIGTEQDLLVGGQSVRAPVAAVIDDVDARTRTVTLIFELPDDATASDGELIRLAHAREVQGSGFWVPMTALTQGLRGMWTLYSIKSEGEGEVVARETVEVLHTETDRAFVRGTLEHGDRVIATGLQRVVPGQRVRTDATVRSEVEEGAR